MGEQRRYIIYDSRADENGGTDDAAVLDVENSLKRAKCSARGFGGGVIYSYRVERGDKADKLLDGRFECRVGGK